eukprot:g2913.t1
MDSSWLTSPLSVVQDIFEKNIKTARKEEDSSNGNTLPTSVRALSGRKLTHGVSSFYGELLANNDNLAKVPYLTKKALDNGYLPNGSLVRYRGMVQDMYDVEYFNSIQRFVRTPPSSFEVCQPCCSLSTCDNTKSTAVAENEKTVTEEKNNRIKFLACKYVDEVPTHQGQWKLDESTLNDPSSPFLTNSLEQRQPFRCIPTPGESTWVTETEIDFKKSDNMAKSLYLGGGVTPKDNTTVLGEATNSKRKQASSHTINDDGTPAMKSNDMAICGDQENINNVNLNQSMKKKSKKSVSFNAEVLEKEKEKEEELINYERENTSIFPECIVKFYDIPTTMTPTVDNQQKDNVSNPADTAMTMSEEEKFDVRLNECIEVIGILSTPVPDRMAQTTSSNDDMEMETNVIYDGEQYATAFNAAERKAHEPPSSIVPRLHVLLYRYGTGPRDLSCGNGSYNNENTMSYTTANENENQQETKKTNVRLENLYEKNEWIYHDYYERKPNKILSDNNNTTTKKDDQPSRKSHLFHVDLPLANVSLREEEHLNPTSLTTTMITFIAAQLWNTANSNKIETISPNTANKIETISPQVMNAARMVLYCLLSRRISSTKNSKVAQQPSHKNIDVAVFSLGITDVTKERSRSVISFFRTIYPQVQVIKVDVPSLNKCRLVPYKDYDANQMITGRLQVAKGTLIIMDATGLKTGKLTESGLRNLQSLQKVLLEHTVDYDMKWYAQPMPVDSPLMVLTSNTSGKEFFLKTDVCISLKTETKKKPESSTVVAKEERNTSTDNTEAMDSTMTDTMFKRLRVFIRNARSLHGDFFISEGVRKNVETHFVEIRQKLRNAFGKTKQEDKATTGSQQQQEQFGSSAENELPGAEDLFRWLTIGRLASIAKLEKEMTFKTYETAVKQLSALEGRKISL